MFKQNSVAGVVRIMNCSLHSRVPVLGFCCGSRRLTESFSSYYGLYTFRIPHSFR